MRSRDCVTNMALGDAGRHLERGDLRCASGTSVDYLSNRTQSSLWNLWLAHCSADCNRTRGVNPWAAVWWLSRGASRRMRVHPSKLAAHDVRRHRRTHHVAKNTCTSSEIARWLSRSSLSERASVASYSRLGRHTAGHQPGSVDDQPRADAFFEPADTALDYPTLACPVQHGLVAFERCEPLTRTAVAPAANSPPFARSARGSRAARPRGLHPRTANTRPVCCAASPERRPARLLRPARCCRFLRE